MTLLGYQTMTTNKIQDLIFQETSAKYATRTGRIIHAKMQAICFPHGDQNLIKQISTNPELMEIMGPLSKPEVPIAGFVNGKFISRRIDRLYINNDTKKIIILDYKTNTDKNLFKQKYIEQLKEYRELLKQIYKNYSVYTKILWLNDFTLENII